MRDLAVHPQWFATGREDAKPRQPRGERIDQVGDGGHEMLTVIEHEQQILIRQPRDDRVLVRKPRPTS
jgi:hypothetical protein